jgi:hypothetical protein
VTGDERGSRHTTLVPLNSAGSGLLAASPETKGFSIGGGKTIVRVASLNVGCGFRGEAVSG